MVDNPLVPIGLLVLVLILGMFGVWQYGKGLDQQGQVAARGPAPIAGHRSLSAWIDRVLRRTLVGALLQERLTNAGMPMRVSTFMLFVLVVGAAAIYLAWTVLAPLFAVVAVLVVGWAFSQYLRHQEDRRKERFVQQLPELARVLSNAFSAGLALRSALDMAADELGDPARSELRKTADSLKLGQSIDGALTELGNRLPSRELSVLVSTLLISARAGGSMVTALRNLSNTLDQRKAVRREVKTVLAEAVYTGYLVPALGVLMLFLVNFLVPGGVRAMTTDPVGLAFLIPSAVLFAVGVLVVRRMSRVDL